MREVFPAHAGMIPSLLGRPPHELSVPRACGDDPLWTAQRARRWACSPRMRG